MPKEAGKTFEEKLNRLNEIVTKIEGDPLPLEETVALYQEGKKLIAELQNALSEAEKKIGDMGVNEGNLK